MKVVEVLWGDAWCSTGEVSFKKAKSLKPVMRTSVGYLVAENDDGVVLAMDKFEDDAETVHTHALIPWGWIEGYWEYR